MDAVAEPDYAVVNCAGGEQFQRLAGCRTVSGRAWIFEYGGCGAQAVNPGIYHKAQLIDQSRRKHGSVDYAAALNDGSNRPSTELII